MKEVVTIGLDIAKQVFQVHGADVLGNILFNKKLRRAEVKSFFDKLPPCVVGIEVCSSAHHWAREIGALGHEVKLIPAQYVKPFVKRGKTDATDAEAINTALVHGSMRFVPVKTREQQAVTIRIKTRALLVRQRTKAINALRSHLAEFGLVVPEGTANWDALAEKIDAKDDEQLPPNVVSSLSIINEQIKALSEQIGKLDKEIALHAKQDEDISRLTTIPGVGPLIASTIKAYVPNAGLFKSARHFAAWLGLAPKTRSTGGVSRLGRISKMGNKELRSLLVLGARSAIAWARKREKGQPWLKRLISRRPYRVVAVAFANKTARIIWALLKKGGIYKQRDEPLAEPSIG
jgi:transposase